MAGKARSEGRETQRQCAVTRARRAPDELLRFVAGPGGSVVPDLKSRLPGRGVWIGCDRATIEKAVATRVFARSLRAPVTADKALADQVESLLQRDAVQRLSLANKAGAVVCGFDKVEQALKKGRVAVLVHASDASPEGCRKLDRLLRAETGADGAPGAIVRSLNCEQLSLALGRSNVIHAALNEGGPARKFMAAAARLARFRAESTAVTAAEPPKTEDE